MDPTNTTPTQLAAPTGPTAGPAPVAPAAPAASVAPAAPAPAAPASPIPSPASPVMGDGATPAASVNPDVANAALNPPVNPVVAPGAASAPAGAASAQAGTVPMNQMFQSQPTNPGVIDDTTAITVPEGPKPPDPVEEELKAPLKAAGPVPGSIGSAVSVPAQGGATPQNVAFNDPANPGANPMTAGPETPSGKKPNFLDNLMAKTKMNKSTLILLCVVAGLVVVVLVAVIVMLATGLL
ncbi:hypothetical protein IJ076_01515 [Candidatus Saccharibacteria bacterium]|nr:hypothetical protein [Candidatus Saccharibacteria bacterium]